MPRRSFPFALRSPAVVAIVLALAGGACAQRLVRAAPARHAPKPGVTAAAPDTSADSLRRVLRAPGGLQRVLTESDSVVKAQGGPRADDAQLYLSWNMPWGSRRAAQARTPACTDTTAEDTLCLGVVTGRDAARFTGFTAQILFHATGKDTLGPWWHMEGKGGENAGSLRVEWPSNPQFRWTTPFRAQGQGFVILDRTPTTARLRMVFAVPYENATPVQSDTMYSLCRVILKHRPERKLAGCLQPVCVEWAEATLAFGAKDEPRVRRGERFVGFAAPYSITEPFRGARVEAWRPKTPVIKVTPGR